MVKHNEKRHAAEHRDDGPDAARLSAVKDVARQIAVLVVRQHRRLRAKGKTHEK